MAGIWTQVQQLDSQTGPQIILKEHDDFHVRIAGEPKMDAQNNQVLQGSWDVQQFMNTPWALDPHSRWEVALTELTLPKTFQMYSSRINPLRFMIYTAEDLIHVFTLPENIFYHSPKELIEQMNTLMEDAPEVEFEAEDESDDGDTTPTPPTIFKIYDTLQFYYDTHSLRVYLRIKKRPPVDMIVAVSEGLQELFNLDDDEFDISSEEDSNEFDRVVFSDIINFRLLTDYIHILLQEANMTFINNKMVPWIYSSSIAPSSVVSHSHTHITIKPVNLCYVPLNYVNSMRNMLTLSVVDNDMNPLKPHNQLYSHNTTVFHLHFRNILPGR